MKEQRSSYRQILQATSLFGGVQIFLIIIAVVRSKFIALLLGPAGMGVVGLLMSTTGLMAGLTNFGLGTSGVKNITEAKSTNDEDKISTTIVVVRRLVWFTGILGAVLTLIFSPLLSQFTFGNKDYTVAFIWLSVTLLFGQLSSGELVLLQGLRKLQQLAKANLYGSLVGLVITIPLYYMLGVDGIVPVIIITAVVSFLFSWIYAKKLKTKKVNVTKEIMVTEGKSMMVLGFMISLSSLVALVAAYLLRVFINHTGNIADVGFYSAGFTIINTYVGMIFTAMGIDFYPRLSNVAKDDSQCRELINQQSEIALLILAPILMAFMVFVNWAVILLYSTQFLSIIGMVYWATLGIFFKAVSWAIAFIFLAKGEGKLFFWNEFAGSIYTLGFSLLGYYLGGLTGLGIAFFITYILYLIQVYTITNIKYGFTFSKSFKIIFIIQFLLALGGFALVNFTGQAITYIFGLLLIAISGWYSYMELEKRIGLNEIVQNFSRKFKQKNNLP